jgi:hypothetical protein
VVKKLLEHGADLRLKDRWGQTAAEQALNMGHYAVSDLLDKAEEQSMEREQDEQQLHLAISSGLMRSTAPARRMPPTPLPDQDRDSDSRGSSSPRYEHQASTMLVTVSHNLGAALEMTLPRDTSYAGLIQLLLDGLGAHDENGAPSIGELQYIAEDGNVLELEQGDFTILTHPSVRQPILDLQVVVLTADENAPQQHGSKQPDVEGASLFGSEDRYDGIERDRQAQLEAIRAEVPEWSAVDVATWLRDVVQLPQYAAVFLEEEVDGELLLWLRATNLEE